MNQQHKPGFIQQQNWFEQPDQFFSKVKEGLAAVQ
jgi:hypothetical protein